MTSFLSRLFGRSSEAAKPEPAPRAGPVAYKDLLIQAAPEPAGGQWRVAGVIVKRGEDGDLERVFQRADTFASREEAEAFAVTKARQIIDERGEGLFADGAASGRA